MYKTVMVSATILWYGVTKTFFVNSNGIKIVKLDDWIFSQDRASSHQSYLMQNFFKIYLKISKKISKSRATCDVSKNKSLL